MGAHAGNCNDNCNHASNPDAGCSVSLDRVPFSSALQGGCSERDSGASRQSSNGSSARDTDEARCSDQSGVPASRYLPGDDDCHSPLRGRRPLGIGRAPGPGEDVPLPRSTVHVALPCAQPGLRFGSVHAGTRPRRDGWLPAGQRRDDRDQRAARASRCGDARDITEEQVSATEDDAAIRAAHALLQEAADIGRELVSSFVSAVRTQHRQSWLAPENVPPRVVWLSDLRDGAGRRLPVGYADPMAVKIMGGMGALTASDVGNLVDQLQQGTGPPLADLLLADAQFTPCTLLIPIRTSV